MVRQFRVVSRNVLFAIDESTFVLVRFIGYGYVNIKLMVKFRRDFFLGDDLLAVLNKVREGAELDSDLSYFVDFVYKG